MERITLFPSSLHSLRIEIYGSYNMYALSMMLLVLYCTEMKHQLIELRIVMSSNLTSIKLAFSAFSIHVHQPSKAQLLG